MSHVTTIEMAEEESYDIEALKQMCSDEGWEWREGQRTFVSYAGHNSCNHAIHVPGAKYEIGVVDEGGKNKLKWDGYAPGGLSRALGNKAEKLKSSYTMAKVKSTAKRHGNRWWSKEIDRVGWKRIFVEV